MPIHADETPRLEDMAFETLTRPGGWLRHLAVGGVNQTNGPKEQACAEHLLPTRLHGVLPRSASSHTRARSAIDAGDA